MLQYKIQSTNMTRKYTGYVKIKWTWKYVNKNDKQKWLEQKIYENGTWNKHQKGHYEEKAT